MQPCTQHSPPHTHTLTHIAARVIDLGLQQLLISSQCMHATGRRHRINMCGQPVHLHAQRALRVKLPGAQGDELAGCGAGGRH